MSAIFRQALTSKSLFLLPKTSTSPPKNKRFSLQFPPTHTRKKPSQKQKKYTTLRRQMQQGRQRRGKTQCCCCLTKSHHVFCVGVSAQKRRPVSNAGRREGRSPQLNNLGRAHMLPFVKAGAKNDQVIALSKKERKRRVRSALQFASFAESLEIATTPAEINGQRRVEEELVTKVDKSRRKGKSSSALFVKLTSVLSPVLIVISNQCMRNKEPFNVYWQIVEKDLVVPTICKGI